MNSTIAGSMNARSLMTTSEELGMWNQFVKDYHS